MNPDDDWADLRSELGLDPLEPKSTPATPEHADRVEPFADATPHSPADDSVDELPEDSGDLVADDETSSSSDSDADELTEGDEATNAEEGDGPKKKRRRRRRRRRRGDHDEPRGQDDQAEDDAGSETEDAEVETVEASAQTELVANWDVPSWSEIVAGLYRPGR